MTNPSTQFKRPLLNHTLLGLGLGLMFMVASCGFQLRGYQDKNLSHLENIALTFAKESFKTNWEYQLRRALLRRGTSVDPTAQSILNITDIHTEKRTISYDRRGKAAEYQLTLSVEFEIALSAPNPTQQGIHPYSNRISKDRVYTFDPQNISGKRQEEMILTGELRSELIQEIMVQLSYISQQQQPNHSSAPLN